MSSAVLTKGGYETGATFVGHSDFLLGDDVVSKLHYGNFTFYSKAIVTNPKNVIIARNIFCQGYRSGNDCEFRTEGGKGDPLKRGSLIAWPILRKSSEKLPNPLDATGSFNNGYQTMAQQQAGPHFPGAEELANYFGLKDDQPDIGTDTDVFLTRYATQNTICYRGHQFSYDPSSKRHSAVTVNTGHWGPNVYPGCGKARAGEMKYLEKQGYSQAITV